jgi:hypothetical protein
VQDEICRLIVRVEDEAGQWIAALRAAPSCACHHGAVIKVAAVQVDVQTVALASWCCQIMKPTMAGEAPLSTGSLSTPSA